MSNVFDYGGTIDGIFYSYDYWRVARLIWDRWNQTMSPSCLTPFEKLSKNTKVALLNLASEVSEFIREDRS